MECVVFERLFQTAPRTGMNVQRQRRDADSGERIRFSAIAEYSASTGKQGQSVHDLSSCQVRQYKYKKSAWSACWPLCPATLSE